MDKTELKLALEKKAASGKKCLTATQRANLVEAIQLSRNLQSKVEPDTIFMDKLPGLSPAQLRAHIDALHQVQIDLALMEKEQAAILKKFRGLEAAQKKGLETLKKAGEQLAEKGKIVVETEKAVLNFTAYTQEKIPGIKQLVAIPDPKKPDEKAGNLYAQIASKFGAEISLGIQELIDQCTKDLTHTADVAGYFKILAKTEGITAGVLKNAGLAETVVSFKDWLSGKVNPLVQRFLGFAGDINKWVKGFVERTKLAKKAQTDVENAIARMMKETEKLLKA